MFWVRPTPYIYINIYIPASTINSQWANDPCCWLHASVWKQVSQHFMPENMFSHGQYPISVGETDVKCVGRHRSQWPSLNPPQKKKCVNYLQVYWLLNSHEILILISYIHTYHTYTHIIIIYTYICKVIHIYIYIKLYI